MAYFKLTQFTGIGPGVSPRLINDKFGQTAENIDFESGVLAPITDDTTVFTLSNSLRRSIYYYDNQHWLQWNDDGVSVARGPIPDDTNKRLYWTGEDYPRMGTYTTMIAGASYPQASYRLGVPAPATAPTTSLTGLADDTQTPNDVSYVYTFVTDFGEEGPPSPASTVFELTDTQSVTVSLPASAVPSGNYAFSTGLAKKRIYRSNTGSTSTEFQFAGEVDITATTFNDTNSAATLGEVLPSETWIGPPDDNTSLYPDGPMQGLAPLANGVLAGFSGNRLCLSESYLPHAWPIAYRITLEEDIVAIAATNNGVICLTNGAPYFVTGTDPSAMTAVRVPVAQACVNDKSVVDMGEFVLYAGPDGLVSVGANASGQVVTRGLISPKQWNADFKPDLIRAFEHEGTYVAFYNDGGTLGGWVFDPRAQEAALSTISVANEVRGGWMNPKDGELNIIVGNTVKKYRGGTTNKTLTWKSKEFILSKPTSMTWIHVAADSYPVDVKVWGDDTLIAYYTISQSGSAYTQATTTPANIPNGTLREPVMRLPSVLAQKWEFEVSGSVVINEVCISQSIEEMAGT